MILPSSIHIRSVDNHTPYSDYDLPPLHYSSRRNSRTSCSPLSKSNIHDTDSWSASVYLYRHRRIYDASIVVTTNFTSQRRLASITTTASVYWRARRAELCVAHNAVASHIAARANNNTTVHSNTGEAAKMFTLHI